MTTQTSCSAIRTGRAPFVGLTAICFCLALATGTMTHTTAHAAPIAFAQLEWKIAAKESALIDADDMMTMMGAMWDVPAQRRLERNMPWVEVRNDAASDANLIEFRMTIGDERFRFSNEIYADYALASVSSPFSNFTTAADNNENDLVVTFNGGGLAPGDVARFRIQLGIDADQPGLMAIWPHPDYRTVLFDMNGIDAWGPSPMTPKPGVDTDNSMGTGTFEKMGMLAVSDPEPFPDATVVGPQAFIFNQFMRPQHVMEDVDVFDAVQVVGQPVVPEPSSLMLAMFGVAVFGFMAQRRSASDRRQYATAAVAYRRQHDPRPQRQIAYRHRLMRRATR